MKNMRFYSFALFGFLVVGLGLWLYTFTQNQDARSKADTIVAKWHPLTIDFSGPTADENQANPNPFLDFRLNVTFTSPTGVQKIVPGFFAGNGQGGGNGNVWRVIFSPDEVGSWGYTASFRSGVDVAVNLSPTAGTQTGFDGETGTFTVTALNSQAPGFRKVGRLEYVGQHYPKFKDGGYFIKAGTDSPENFLAFQGFDNTQDQGGLPAGSFLHSYNDHRGDWQVGDPTFGTNPEVSKGIIGALNYLSAQQVNSVYFLPMNLGGDGQDTYPFISPTNTLHSKTHYDISKLDQWRTVFEHAQKKGIMLHFVLSETEAGNTNWLGGINAFTNERRLFFRELIARFGYNLAVQWNLGEESNFPSAMLNSMANYISSLDTSNHQIVKHSYLDDITVFNEIYASPYFTGASVQYSPDNASNFVEQIRNTSNSTGRKWIVGLDENFGGLDNNNIDSMRKKALYDIYFSGGVIEWYYGYHDLPLGGDLNAENFRTRETMWKYMRFARSFMEENLPFWEMQPNDGLVNGEHTGVGSAQVFTKPNEQYAIYFPGTNPNGDHTNGVLNLTGTTGSFTVKWFNPRVGVFEGSPSTVTGGANWTIPPSPAQHGEDWVLLVTKGNIPSPTTQAFAEQDGIIVIQNENHPFSVGWLKQTNVPGYTNSGYLNWTGGDFFSEPGHGMIEYKIWITHPGTYQLRFRNFHNHFLPDQENDIWVKLDNQAWIKAFSYVSNEWNWTTNWEFSETNKPAASYFLTPGLHTLYLSGRSNNFRIDRLHLYLDTYTNPLDTNIPESPYGTPDPAPTELVLMNSGFEDISGQPWKFGRINRSITNSHAHSGNYSIKVNQPCPACPSQYGEVYSFQQDVYGTINKNDTYTYSIWVKPISQVPFTGRIALWEMGGTEPNQSHGKSFTLVELNTWVKISVEGKVTGTGRTHLNAAIYLDTPNNITAAFDDAEIYKGATASPSPGATTSTVFKTKLEAINRQIPNQTIGLKITSGNTIIHESSMEFVADTNGVLTSVQSIPIAQGTYDVFISGSRHLTKKLKGVQFSNPQITIDTTSQPLLAGDIFNDEFIDTNDYNEVVTFYACSLPPASPPPGKTCTYFDSDLDLNGTINLSDYNIIVDNYFLRGNQ